MYVQRWSGDRRYIGRPILRGPAIYRDECKCTCWSGFFYVSVVTGVVALVAVNCFGRRNTQSQVSCGKESRLASPSRSKCMYKPRELWSRSWVRFRQGTPLLPKRVSFCEYSTIRSRLDEAKGLLQLYELLVTKKTKAHAASRDARRLLSSSSGVRLVTRR